MKGKRGRGRFLWTLFLFPVTFLHAFPSTDDDAGASVNVILSSSHSLTPPRGLHLPIVKRQRSTLTNGERKRRRRRRRGVVAGSIGLGDFLDVTYTVMVDIGRTSTPLVLDTGSSDLWVISDACTSISATVPFYPQANFDAVPGCSALLYYGDSLTGTHAFGIVGKDTVNLAGLGLENQCFAAINETTTSVTETGAAGIFGLGFPVNSVLWRELFDAFNPEIPARAVVESRSIFPEFSRSDFPDLTSLAYKHAKSNSSPKAVPPNTSQRFHSNSRLVSLPPSSFTHAVFSSFARSGPLLGRLVMASVLRSPHFTVTLQRDTVEVGGNVGLLSVGELPAGVNESSLVWAKVRTYSVEEGGLPPPANSPKERYPITWEVFIDDVFLDGVKLPRSNLSSSSIALSALIDTGNSLLRGPADVVKIIRTMLSGGSASSHFLCSEPHRLEFQIGGHLFPVDPRDFIHQELEDSVQWCLANIDVTDPPGRYLYSWSLGDPFLKGVSTTFYYGNLTYPSRDPPKIGFLSTVPRDAEDKLKEVITSAKKNGGRLVATSESAPHAKATSMQSYPTGGPVATSGAEPRYGKSWRWMVGPALLLLGYRDNVWI